MIYSIHTRLGMNGHIRHVTTYKYTNLKHIGTGAEHAKGTLYSVIKNWYDTSGYIVHDSTAIFYNPRSAYGYCKEYTYSQQNGTLVILINTRFDCMPPYDNKAIVPTIVELTVPNDSTVLAREYEGTELQKIRKNIVSSYRFTVVGGLIRTTVFDAYKKGKSHNGISTYTYDEYNNFTQTTLKVGESPQQVIDHKISTIDDHGNTIRMLNFVDNNPEPDFMTIYEFEYYD
ncbi:MAG: hypothetical protein KDC07_10090 [Chitinophagaceae bacterium]|nr:hypothetical protein [Chitinophagaceae bacterium]MCB9047210.1 hypothetical protein [Chitinophagales bacterium]